MTKLSGPETGPKTGGEAKQLIVLLHGVGADGNDLMGLAPLLAERLPEAHFAAPNAPYAFDMAPMGHQWFSLQDTSAEQMLAGVQAAAPPLDAYIDEKLQQVGLDESALALLGFSQGTMMALHVALRRPRQMAGLLGYSGALIAPELLERELASRPPVCLIHGDSDPVVPVEAMQLAERALTLAGVSVRSAVRPGLEHSIDPEGLAMGVAFLEGVLTGQVA